MFAISPTDIDWFEFLKKTGYSNEINFWTPTPWNISKFKSGEKLFFMLKSPIRKIGGFGEFKEYVNKPLSEAWNQFGKRNGCSTKEELINRLDKYKNKRSFDKIGVLNSEIGCIVLNNVEFWDSESYLDLDDYEIDFSPNIVKIKYFEEKAPFSDTHYSIPEKKFDLVGEKNEKYKKTREVTERKGQSSFRAAITKAYNRTCCITGEEIPELIEAAHIQPYINQSSNHIQNGLLLRVDFHKLYDNGLLFINEQFIIEISSLIKNEYYQSFHGKRILLPTSKLDYPSTEALKSRKFEFRYE